MTPVSIFLAVYGAVFIAEIVGDKLLYTTGVLATRYRATPIIVGMILAFMVKMGVAVAVGEAIAHLPRYLVATLTTISFAGIAYTLWKKPDERSPEKQARDQAKAALMSFSAIFLSEWGDVGQITAATMTAKYKSPLLVIWLGAVAAMVTKSILAAFLGAGIRQWIRDRIPPKTVRIVAVVALGVLGIAAVIEELFMREA